MRRRLKQMSSFNEALISILTHVWKNISNNDQSRMLLSKIEDSRRKNMINDLKSHVTMKVRLKSHLQLTHFHGTTKQHYFCSSDIRITANTDQQESKANRINNSMSDFEEYDDNNGQMNCSKYQGNQLRSSSRKRCQWQNSHRPISHISKKSCSRLLNGKHRGRSSTLRFTRNYPLLLQLINFLGMS